MQQTRFFDNLARRTWIFIVLAGLLVAAVAAPIAGAHHRADHQGGGPQPGDVDGMLTVEITGEIPDVDGIFDGTFTVQSFRVIDGTLHAVGTLAGTLTDGDGNVIGDIQETGVALPVSGWDVEGDVANNVCEILFLELGPLELDLLGLQVFLDQVTLEIVAEPGPGNLLGNLLCAVVHLLDDGFSLNIIADLLNVIIDILNDLDLG
jgi:hypothetical protein